jgi:hypothetical protein
VLPWESNNVFHLRSYWVTKYFALPQTILTHLKIHVTLPTLSFDFYPIWIFSLQIFTVSRRHVQWDQRWYMRTKPWGALRDYTNAPKKPKLHSSDARRQIGPVHTMTMQTKWRYGLKAFSIWAPHISRQFPDVDDSPWQWPNERLVIRNKPGVV